MSNTLMTIIGIFLAVILMFIFPLMELGGKNDEISQTVVQVAVSDFVNKTAAQGKITGFNYDTLVQQLGATGNTYDIEIEAKILDDNPRRATATSTTNSAGEYKYYSVYTNTIIDKMNENEQREYLLKKDDYIIVTVKNTNITLGTQLKNFLYKFVGNETYTIGTSSSALVLNAGQTQVKPEKVLADIPPEEIYIEIIKKTQTLSNSDVIFILDDSGSMKTRDYVEPLKETCNGILDIMVNEISDDANFYIGFVKFANEAEEIGRMTSASKVNDLKYSINHNLVGSGGTKYNKGLLKAMEMINRDLIGRTNQRVVIFLTDGTSSDTSAATESVKSLYNTYNVDGFFSIGYGGSVSEVIKDWPYLEGFEFGEYYDADTTDLFDKFKEILYEINENSNSDFVTTVGRRLEIADMEVTTEKPITIKVTQYGSVIKEITITTYPTSSEGVLIIEDGKIYLSLEGLANECRLEDFEGIDVSIEYYSS